MYILKEKTEDFIVEEQLELELNPKGEYTYFILKKEGWNTLAAIDVIARKLHIPTKRFNIAGIKDKNAITTQYVSVFRIPPHKLEEIRIGGIDIKVVGKGDDRIKLGQLSGNKFLITIKNLDKEYEPITFIENYYDDQRFAGTNHLIGRSFAQHRWSEATSILRLNVNGNDYLGALRNGISRKMLQFYLNAYQSYLWNEVVRMHLETNYKEGWKVDYQAGQVIFSNEKIENKLIPLLGYLIQLRDEEIKPYYETLMQQDEITQETFIFREMPELRSEGNERAMIVELKDFKIKYEQDNVRKDKKQCVMEFTLPAGSYATMVVKKMFGRK